MTEPTYPTSGGRWSRDPKTGALTKVDESAAPLPASAPTAVPAETAAPEPTDAGAFKSKSI